MALGPMEYDEGNIKVLEGTTPNTVSTPTNVPFPTGFTQDNCVIIGFQFYDSAYSVWRTFGVYSSSVPCAITVTLTTTGVNYTPRTSEGTGKPCKVVLYKYS